MDLWESNRLTTMKSLSARIRSSTAELDDMGEEYNEVTESASDYRAEIKQLTTTATSQGVDILDSNGDYRSTYDILVDIAEVWDEISDKNQAALMEDLAGKRNVSVVQSIITNIDSMKDSLVDAQNASGTTAEANEQVMDSIAMKVKQLQAAFQELSTDIISSDLVKTIVDAGTKIIDVLDSIINKFGLIPTVFTFGNFGTQIGSIVKTLENVQSKVNGSVDGILLAVNELGKQSKSTQNYVLSSVFGSGSSSRRMNLTSTDTAEQDINIENYLARITQMSDAEKILSLSFTDVNEQTRLHGQTLKDVIYQMGQVTDGSQLLSGALYDQQLANAGVSDDMRKTITQTLGLVDATGKYSLVVKDNLSKSIEDLLDKQTTYNGSSTTLRQILKDQKVDVDKLSTTLVDNVSKLQHSANATEELTIQQRLANTATKAWNTSLVVLKQVLTSLAIGAAISLITKFVTAVANAETGISLIDDTVTNFKNSLRSANEVLEDSKAKLQESQNEVSEIENKIEQLNQTVEEAGYEQISDIVDPTEREKLQEINGLLERQLELRKGNEADAKDKVNEDAYDVLTEKGEKSTYNLDPGVFFKKVTTQEALDEQNQQIENAYNHYIEAITNDDNTELSANNIKYWEGELDTLFTRGDELDTKLNQQIDSFDTSADNISDYSDEISNAIDTSSKFADMSLKVKNALNGIVEVDPSDTIEKFRKKLEDYIQQANAQESDITMSRDSINIDNWLRGLQNGGALQGISNGTLINMFEGTAQVTDEQADAFANLKNMADSLNISFYDLVNGLTDIGLVVEDATSEIENFEEYLEQLNSDIDTIQSAYGTLTTAIEEYNTYGYMSLDALQELIALDPQYLNCLEMENGQLRLNEQGLIDLAVARYEEMNYMLVQNAITELGKIANGDYKDSVDESVTSLKDQAEQLGKTTDKMDEYASAAAVAAGDAALLNAYESAAAVDEEAANKVIENLAKQQQMIQDQVASIRSGGINLRNQMSGFSSSSGSSGSSGSGSDSKADEEQLEGLKNISSAWSTLTDAMDEYNTYGAITLDTMKDLYDLEDEYTKCLVEEVDAQGNLTGKLAINTDEYLKLLQVKIEEAKASNDSEKSAEELQRIYDYLSESAKGTTISIAELTDVIEGFGTALDNAQSKADDFQGAFETTHNAMKDIIQNNGQIDYSTATDIVDLIQEHSELEGILFDENGQLQVNEESIKAMTVALLDNMIAATENKQVQEALKGVLEGVNEGTIEATDFWLGYGTVLDEANEKLDDYQSNYDDLCSVVDEYNKYGALSQDSYQTLLQMAPEYIACLDYENGKLTLNTEAYKNLYVAELEELALQNEGTKAGEIYAAMLDDVRSGVVSLTDHFDGLGTELDEITTKFELLISILNQVTDWFSDELDETSNSLQIWGEAIIDELDARIDALEEEKEALEDTNDEEERAIELAQLKDALARAQSQRSVRQYTDNGYEWVADASAIKDAQDELSDSLREWNLEDAEQAIDDQIDALEELKEQYQDVIDLIGTSWEDYQAQLEAAAAAQGMSLSDMEASLSDYKDSVLENMKAIQVATDVSETISNLETVLDFIGNILELFDSDWYSLIKNVFNLFSGDSSSGNWITQLTGNDSGSITDTISSMFEQWGNSGSNSFLSGLGDIWTKVKGTFSNLGTNIGNFFSDLSGTFTGYGGGIIDSLISGISNAGGGIIDTFSSVFSGVGSLITGLFSGSSGTTLLGSIGSLFSSGTLVSSIGSVSSVFSGLGTTVTGVISSIGTALGSGTGLSGIVGTVTSALGTAATSTGVLGTALSALTGPVGVAIAAIGGVVTAIGSANGGEGLVGSFITGVQTVATYAWDLLTSVGESIANFASSLWSSIKNIASGLWDGVKSITSSLWSGIKSFFGFASGTTSVPNTSLYNVDEKGEELIVRQPKSGRVTYLEAGDGVVPADITKTLFEMGGDPTGWFAEQFGKMSNGLGSNLTASNTTSNISTGNIVINNPVGDVNTLSKQIVQRLPLQLKQDIDKR